MHYSLMRSSQLTIRIPKSALREFDQIEAMDWSDGLTLPQLLQWINAVAARFRPDEIGEDSRASEEFSPRSFRHYQTLGCIDAPERLGKQAVYRFRHYVQALLLRRLIWERVPAERIAALMSGRSTAETKQLLLEGIEFVARQSDPVGGSVHADKAADTWKRINVVPGVELHVRADLPKPKPAELRQWLSRLESALRKNV
jgi:DNA-binding transcriptional MerR regulator